VLVTGGFLRDTAEIWDPATNTWRLIAARMSRFRQDHTATLLSDGNVLIAGGQAGTDISTGGFAELFNPLTEDFTPVQSADESGTVAPMPVARESHTVTRLPDGRLLIVGGTDALQASFVPQVLLYE